MKRKEELKELLVVVDMINGFIKEGNMADKTINHITPNIIKLIEETLGKEEGIAFIKDTHNTDSTEFKKFPIHCLEGTSEAELIDELKPYEKNIAKFVMMPGNAKKRHPIVEARTVALTEYAETAF